MYFELSIIAMYCENINYLIFTFLNFNLFRQYYESLIIKLNIISGIQNKNSWIFVNIMVSLNYCNYNDVTIYILYTMYINKTNIITNVNSNYSN